jgi:hypothetical protein
MKDLIWVLVLPVVVLILCCSPVRADGPMQTATPMFSPEGGIFSEPQIVSLLCLTPGSLIRYTLDGSDPFEGSDIYFNPILVDHDLTLKAKAWGMDFDPSAIAYSTYIITPEPASLSLLVLGGLAMLQRRK